MKFTLFCLYEQLVLQESLKHSSNVMDMYGLRAGEYQDIIKIYKHKPVQHISQNIINKILEHCGGVCQPEGHDQVLVVS